MRDRVGAVLVLAAVFLVGASPAFAQKKALAELTTEDVQTRVKLYLESKGQAVELAEVVVDAAKIKLRKGTENVYTLEWAYLPAFGELSPAAQKAVERKLQEIMEHVLNKFQGGLVARNKQEKITYRFVLQPAQARTVTLEQLTTPMVRRQVERFLRDRPTLAGALESRVVLDVGNLDYRKPSEGLALVWRVPRRALPNDEESTVRKDLVVLLVAALAQGGLVSPKDLKTLAPNVRIQFVDRAAQAPPRRTEYYAVWRMVCGCCGSVWVVEWRPYPASGTPGRGPEVIGEPRRAGFLTGESKPIVVERPPLLLPSQVQWYLGGGSPGLAAATARTAANNASEFRLPREGELVDDYPKDAAACYARGRAAYLHRDYAEARAYLTHAVKLNDQDARFWYFKALAELAMARRDLASVSAQRGKDLEARGLPTDAQIRVALQGVPEEARQFLATLQPPTVAQPLASAR